MKNKDSKNCENKRI